MKEKEERYMKNLEKKSREKKEQEKKMEEDINESKSSIDDLLFGTLANSSSMFVRVLGIATYLVWVTIRKGD